MRQDSKDAPWIFYCPGENGIATFDMLRFQRTKAGKAYWIEGALKEDLFTPHNRIVDCQVMSAPNIESLVAVLCICLPSGYTGLDLTHIQRSYQDEKWERVQYRLQGNTRRLDWYHTNTKSISAERVSYLKQLRLKETHLPSCWGEATDLCHVPHWYIHLSVIYNGEIQCVHQGSNGLFSAWVHNAALCSTWRRGGS